MLKTKPQPGAKIRCVDTAGYPFLTRGKIYETTPDPDDNPWFTYIDDDGDEITYYVGGTEREVFILVEDEPTSAPQVGDFAKRPEWDNYLLVIKVEDDQVLLQEDTYQSWYSKSKLTFKKKEEVMQDTSKDSTPDAFQVGDVVWCIFHGKGRVTSVSGNTYPYPVKVVYEGEAGYNFYTLDGRFTDNGPRALFFSEPKIEASVNRPFVPSLVGKKVVLQYFDGSWSGVVTIDKETHDMVYYAGDGYDPKDDLLQIYEVSSENLLKK